MFRAAEATFDGFVHAGDRVLLDGKERELLLRGVGLGNWLLPEGYMWRFPDHVDSPRRIEAAIERAVGADRAMVFWHQFRNLFVAEGDVRRIADEGFNHVRLPINWRLVMDEGGAPLHDGLALIDGLIEWCRQHQLWVILDLHGAPGGQTGTNIDDSPNRRPELFEHSRWAELTVEVWTLLATRYRNEAVVAGYDLLNEPLPDDYQHRYADRLVELYLRLTEAIRRVDPNHLIIYEGTHWATNWSIFTEVWDPNSLLQFHRYWCPPDRPHIAQYLETRDRIGLPIYMGEGGENNLDWIQTAFQLFEDHDISWNFWPWKKIDTLTSPCSVEAPPGWPESILHDPDPEKAWSTLEELLHRMTITRCTYRPELVNAMFRRAPLRLPATGFSFKGSGESYGTTAASPRPDFRPDDDVTIRHATGPTGSLNFHHTDGRPRADDESLPVALRQGDWLSFDVELRHAAPVEVVVDLELATTDLAGALSVEVGRLSVIAEAPSDRKQWLGRTMAPVPAGRVPLRLTAQATLIFRHISIAPNSPIAD
jgi:endoglucanase